jgi:tetratricopeptide (TPR) repeat protein
MPEDGRPLWPTPTFARAESRAFDDAAAERLTKALEIDPATSAISCAPGRRAALGRGAMPSATPSSSSHASRRPRVARARRGPRPGPAKSDREARAAFAKAAKFLGPEDPRPSLGEGRAFLSARRHQEALAALSAAAERPQKRRAEILTWRSRAYSALGDWEAAHRDLSRALPDLERTLDERRRAGAAPRGMSAARVTLADAYFRRGLANEALKAKDPALADHRTACDLGLRPACARVAALEKPEPKDPPKPKARKAPRRKNPKGDAGERIYAN